MPTLPSTGNPFRSYRDPYLDLLPYGIQIAAGHIPGWTGVYKFGRNPLASSNTEDVWDGGGTYTWLTAAQGVTLYSSDAADSDANTGARTLFIQGLDSDGRLQDETVSLSGTDGTLAANRYYRLFRMYVVTCGTDATQTNIGELRAVSTDGTVMAKILEGNGQTLMSIYTVPSNMVAYPIDYHVSLGASNKTAVMKVLTRANSTSPWLTKQTDEVVGANIEHEFQYYGEIPGWTDIRVTATLADGQTNEVSSQFTLLMRETDS